MVRNRFLPKRMITIGVGQVEVQQSRVRDPTATGSSHWPFTLKILPPCLRKSKTIEELIPWLYLKGVSTGDFSEALKALVGPDCPGPYANTSTSAVSPLSQKGEGNLLCCWSGNRTVTSKIDVDHHLFRQA